MIVAVLLPSAVVEPAPAIEEVVAETELAENTTVPPLCETGPVILSVLVSAVVDDMVQVLTPVASVAEQPP